MSALRAWVADPYFVRRVTYGVFGGAVVVSLLAAVARGTTSYAVSAVVPVTVALSLPSRRWRSTVLATGALVVLTAGGVATFQAGSLVLSGEQ